MPLRHSPAAGWLFQQPLKRWRKAFCGDGEGKDRCKCSSRLVDHRLSVEERQRILLTCNQPQYVALSPGQIVPALAD